MESMQDLIRIRVPLQVGGELRIKNSGEISLGIPQLELAQNPKAVDAVLLYHFDQRSGEHIICLLDPVADHKHHRV
jgi:hypothetical protein